MDRFSSITTGDAEAILQKSSDEKPLIIFSPQIKDHQDPIATSTRSDASTTGCYSPSSSSPFRASKKRTCDKHEKPIIDSPIKVIISTPPSDIPILNFLIIIIIILQFIIVII